MPNEAKNLADTIRAMRPVVPAKDFETSKRFYADLGFEQRTLTDGLVEMRLGAYSFLLQRYYVEQWADHFVIHMLVSDLGVWWEHIVALDLGARYGVKTRAPVQEGWGLVAGIVDPSGVLWRIVQTQA
jgi:catechol 2,3-dioxygenase-like lactoylglutathione lyase family enzyme